MSFDYEKVKHLLACPKTGAELVFEESALISVDPDSKLSFPIVDQIPRLLTDEAVELSQEEWSAAMKRHDRDEQTGHPTRT